MLGYMLRLKNFSKFNNKWKQIVYTCFYHQNKWWDSTIGECVFVPMNSYSNLAYLLDPILKLLP